LGASRDKNVSIVASNDSVTVGQAYAAHLHTGTCVAVGNIALSLPTPVGLPGQPGAPPSASIQLTIPVTYATPDFVLDFHATVAGVERRVACGALR
jgi:hypothetical protein